MQRLPDHLSHGCDVCDVGSSDLHKKHPLRPSLREKLSSRMRAAAPDGRKSIPMDFREVDKLLMRGQEEPADCGAGCWLGRFWWGGQAHGDGWLIGFAANVLDGDVNGAPGEV